MAPLVNHRVYYTFRLQDIRVDVVTVAGNLNSAKIETITIYGHQYQIRPTSGLFI